MVDVERHLERLEHISKLVDLVDHHEQSLYKKALRRGIVKYSLELPLESIEHANRVLQDELGSEHDVLTLSRLKTEADPELRKDFPEGISEDLLRFEEDQSRRSVRIEGHVLPMFIFLNHLKATLQPIQHFAVKSAAREYLGASADILREKGYDVDSYFLEQHVETLADAHNLYRSLDTAPTWFWEYARMHGMRPEDIVEHMVRGVEHRDFWKLLHEHPELRPALHPDFAPYLSGNKSHIRRFRERLIENKRLLSQVDPTAVSRAIRVRGVKNIVRLLKNPGISLEDLVTILSRPRPAEEIDFLLSRLSKYGSMDQYVLERLSDRGQVRQARFEKVLNAVGAQNVPDVSHRLPPDLRHLSKDPVFLKSVAKQYSADPDFKRALIQLPDAFLSRPVRALLAQYASTGNPEYLRQAVAHVSEYGKMLRNLPSFESLESTVSDPDHKAWERLILKNPVYKPLRQALHEAGIDPVEVLDRAVNTARSASGYDIVWARHPRHARKIIDSVLRDLGVSSRRYSSGQSGTISVENEKYLVGAAAEAIRRLLEGMGGETNVWKNPKGHIVIPIRGLKDHDAKFAAKVPDYLQKAVGRPLPMELKEHEIRVPADRLPDLISGLRELEDKLQGGARKDVRRFRKILERFTDQ